MLQIKMSLFLSDRLFDKLARLSYFTATDVAFAVVALRLAKKP